MNGLILGLLLVNLGLSLLMLAVTIRQAFGEK